MYDRITKTNENVYENQTIAFNARNLSIFKIILKISKLVSVKKHNNYNLKY